MEHGEHHFESRFVLLFVHIHRDTATVIDNGNGIVFVDSNLYIGGITGKSLVDRVINHLIYKMVQAFAACVANIHRGAFSHRLKTFKHLNTIG